MIKAWIKAFRLRTLPLSFSPIILGNSYAYFLKQFDWIIFTLSITTTLSLQILSNLANDYGDFKKGTDDHTRIGPERALQSGAITISAMKRAIYLFVLLCLASGIGLIYAVFGLKNLPYALGFLGLGIFAIWAAVNYTSGHAAYGYRALGDVFVFIFFGAVGVMGSFYLQTQSFEIILVLPTLTVGLFSVGVLNINNLRDLEPDKASGKITIPVLLGRKKAKIYHLFLLDIGLMSAFVWCFRLFESTLGLIILTLPVTVIFKNAVDIWKNKDAKLLNPKLRNLALGTFFFCVVMAVGLNL